MPLVSSRELLLAAQQGKYAVGAFNAENLEMAQAIVGAAEALQAPVLLQTTAGTLRYAPPALFAGFVSRLAREVKVPVALHLDHGDSLALAEQCVREGYTSVMIDGSLLPFSGNVTLTRQVVAMACDIPVEAELGTVGGKEDDHNARPQYTDPAEAADFVEKTGISSFAVAIGTAHGIYKGEPKLDLELLTRIRQTVSIPLVLHGTSGVPADQVRACIERGVCKVNYATELRITFTDAVRAYLAAKPDQFDPKKYLGAGREAVKARVMELIRLCGSDGKA
ncbi:MAG: class II fructose-bisphosphate aldolase [Candidatus Limiplasma sp.]|nr:class II fructose-bisphosphate aldolase [Candidatus Limiplasma sp.]